MAKKGSQTRCSYLKWEDFEILKNKLEEDKQYQFLMLAICSTYFAMRISDTLSLKWVQILNQNQFEIIERKSGRKRSIIIIPVVKQKIQSLFQKMQIRNTEQNIFLNSKKEKTLSIQWVNQRLKILFQKYGISTRNVSSHIFRKTITRQLYNINGSTDKSLHIIQHLLNHRQIETTKIYLDIIDEEVASLYQSLYKPQQLQAAA